MTDLYKQKYKTTLNHRLECIKEDVAVLVDFIEKQNLTETFKQMTVAADEAWHHISNIEIACDLEDDAPSEWSCASSCK
ncbi:MAG: hypothetical protein CBC02_008215 [Flavobacteriaceae bacterium TMED42]|nr:MAG: hypothetical protein CBC02_008215 [Flavobacteriaceae bacterium TMED42]|tara:strand:+ start:1221 stop:1457 length:237 start_codon:yes stop_codon:yes gene_type:complete